MKASEIRELNASELEKKLADLKKELFNLRFQHAINQLDNPHKIDDVKKDIARCDDYSSREEFFTEECVR